MSDLVERADGVTLVPFSVASNEVKSQPVEAACLALSVLSEYGTLTGQSASAPARDLVVDLVADLMHLCAQSGISFDAVVEQASALVDSDCDDLFKVTPEAG